MIKKALLFSTVLLGTQLVFAAGPTKRHKDPATELEFINVYQDIRGVRVSSSTLPSGSTQYLQNTNTLQAGATMYVASGTVSGTLIVGGLSANNAIISGPLIIITSGTIANFTATSGTFSVINVQNITDFYVTQNSARTDFTGDGYIAPLSWDTEALDPTNSFNASTFTVPTAGVYEFCCSVTFQNILTTHANIGMGIQVNGNYLTGGTYRKVWNLTGNAMTLFSQSVQALGSFAVGDKIGCNAFATGSTKTVDSGGDASFDYFWGHKVN